ncbi:MULTISPECIES: hypothetical protein [unclassified Streptomyces]|uniref:hypothetical protein n=1 Tax=unclassified Streptomyces TaxID=2593676 RepID=UPI00225254E0|nr:hypothetical protein [Streptomyces sp. NBC_00047]MCX5613517.1 hypothetical protein [Streptomyces sp. NBC_00047]
MLSSVPRSQKEHQGLGAGDPEPSRHRLGGHAAVTQRTGRLPPDAGGDPLQHADGAQRGQRRVLGRGGQLLGDLDQEGGQRLGQRYRPVADEGQVRVPVRQRPGQVDVRLSQRPVAERVPVQRALNGAHTARSASARGRPPLPS